MPEGCPRDDIGGGGLLGAKCGEVSDKLSHIFGWRHTYKVHKLQRCLAEELASRQQFKIRATPPKPITASQPASAQPITAPQPAPAPQQPASITSNDADKVGIVLLAYIAKTFSVFQNAEFKMLQNL